MGVLMNAPPDTNMAHQHVPPQRMQQHGHGSSQHCPCLITFVTHKAQLRTCTLRHWHIFRRPHILQYRCGVLNSFKVHRLLQLLCYIAMHYNIGNASINPGCALITEGA